MSDGPGSPMRSFQNESSAPAASHRDSSHCWASWPPCVSAYLIAMNEAKPSFSQMSRHWCDGDRVTEPLVRQLVHQQGRRRPARATGYVGRVWFSSAKPGDRLVTSPPVWLNG